MAVPELGHRARAAEASAPVLQGRVMAAALWFPASWFDETERARRVLAQWRAGSNVLRFDQGDLLRFAQPVEMTCEAAQGWPLQQQGTVLCSAPLSPREAARLPAADIHIVEGGRVSSLRFADARVLDPSAWLAPGVLALHDTYDCSAALPEADLVTPPAARPLREVLDGKVPPPSDAQQAFLRRLAQRREHAQDKPRAAPKTAPKPRAPAFRWPPGVSRALAAAAIVLAMGLLIVAFMVALGLLMSGEVGAFFVAVAWAALAGAVVAFVRMVRRVLRSPSRRVVREMPVAAPRAVESPAASTPERARRFAGAQAWRQWLARLAVVTQAGRLLGWRQGAYVRRMLELFESGRLDEALRHAIPLGGEGGSLGQAFGVPQARRDLSLHRGQEAGVSIHLGTDLDAHLRQLYRRTFERLDREGRIEEAVYVLAQLLESRLEALDYLERHERFAQAAELALAWDMPADVIVRLLCQAGEWPRAVAVARRDRAFAGAVLHLEKKRPALAAKLRADWARTLAAQGDWLAAVDTIWPVEDRRHDALEWLRHAEAAGGQLAAAALVKWAVLLPQALHDHAVRLEALRDDAERVNDRAAMAQALLAEAKPHPQVVRLARVVARGVLADHARGCGTLSRSELRKLLTLADDRLLEADLPEARLPERVTRTLREHPEALTGELPDAGALAIRDAVALEDERCLVALGEAGAVVVDAHARIVARYAVPADRIVIAHTRRIALLLAARGALTRVSRLDLARRHVGDLGVAELGCFALEFDGLAWTVADARRMRVLDTQRSLTEVLWQVNDLPGQVVALSAEPALEQVAMATPSGEFELWRYQLPSRRLAARGEALPNLPTHEGGVRVLDPAGGACVVWPERGSDEVWLLAHRTSALAAQSPTLTSLPDIAGARLSVQAEAGAGWLMAGVADGAQVHWRLLTPGHAAVHAAMAWPQAALPRARLQGRHALVFDNHGRLWHLDTATSVMRGLSLR